MSFSPLFFLALYFPVVVRGHYEVHEPSRLAGRYVDEPGHFSPPIYEVTGNLVLAASCPCDWLPEDEDSPRVVDPAL